MPTTMAALSSSSIRHAEFIKLTLPTGSYYYCNAAGPITVNGMTFNGLGDLLQLGDIQRDIKATSDDLTIALTGIDGNNVYMILNQEVKGSKVEVWRGFLDSENQIITSPSQQFFKRYQGIVNNMSITEEFNDQLRIRVATCSISCASFRVVLENRISGIKTNPVSWKKWYPADSSMDRVPVIVAQYFDFGAPPKTGSQSTESTQTPSVDTIGSSAG